MLENIQSTTQYIKSRIGDFEPEAGIILGTGLGGLVKEIEIEKQMMYSNIPDFPISTLEFAECWSGRRANREWRSDLAGGSQESAGWCRRTSRPRPSA